MSDKNDKEVKTPKMPNKLDPVFAQLVQDRKQIIFGEGLGGVKQEEEKPKSISAEKYLYRQFLGSAVGDERIIVKLLYKSGAKSAYARVNMYSMQQSAITQSFFVKVHKFEDGWKHDTLSGPGKSFDEWKHSFMLLAKTKCVS